MTSEKSLNTAKKNLRVAPLLVAAILSFPVLAENNSAPTPTVEKTVKIGKQLYELVFSQKQNLVYVASFGPMSMSENEMAKIKNHQIFALNGNTLQIEKTINTDELATFGMGINNASGKLYVGDTTSGKVGVFDIYTGARITTIQAPKNSNTHLREIIADEVNNKIYVTAVGGMEDDGKPESKSYVWVVNGKNDKIESLITSPVSAATGLALDSAASRLYVSDMMKNEVAEIDTKTNKVLRYFSTGAQGKKNAEAEKSASGMPNYDTINIDIDPLTHRLFSANQTSGTVTVVNIPDGKLIKTIKTGDGALSVKWNSVKKEIFVTNRADGTVSIINGDTYHILAHLPSGSQPQTLAVDNKTGAVYVSNRSKGADFGDTNAPEPYEPGGDTVTKIKP